MIVIPVINCPNFDCVKKRLGQVKALESDWVHIDIADGKFAPVKTWNNSEEFSKLLTTHYKLRFNIEVHLMVECPEKVFESWLATGAKRIIVHLESFHGRERELNKIFEKCAEYDAEVMLAIVPKTPTEELISYLDSLLFAQILAVPPGFSGQHFQESALQKIRFLRERAPELTIEVDGGMNPKTAKLVRDAGADIIAAASFIFKSENPNKAYEKLRIAASEE